MLRVILVDDNTKRSALFKSAIESRGYDSGIELIICETADRARVELKSYYDLMVLDVVLPKKVGATPHPLNSLNLLQDLHKSNSKYLKPGMIIGLTADVKDIAIYRERFGERFITVTEGSTDSLDWLNRIIKSIEGLLEHEKKIIVKSTDKVLITIHGIRTFGHWQQSLRDTISSYSKEFEYIDMKYGFFDILSFAVPYLRVRTAKKIAFRMKSIIESNSDKNIYLVAHSFGTLITSIAIDECVIDKKIKLTIFCGSPLPHDHAIDHVIEKSETTINECGTKDLVLIFARMFILGIGDAGRIGFSRETNKTFLNRYHRGGHSLYFKEKTEPKFYEKYWSPLMSTDADPTHIDLRKNFPGEDVLDLTIKLTSKLKPIIYLAVLLGITSMLFR